MARRALHPPRPHTWTSTQQVACQSHARARAANSLERPTRAQHAHRRVMELAADAQPARAPTRKRARGDQPATRADAIPQTTWWGHIECATSTCNPRDRGAQRRSASPRPINEGAATAQRPPTPDSGPATGQTMQGAAQLFNQARHAARGATAPPTTRSILAQTTADAHTARPCAAL